jgi:methyl-accepting chemotaxis protein
MPDAVGPLATTNPIASEDLNLILQDWAQLITSLGSLIRENVEGLLPAVFGLASLASRVNDTPLGGTGQTRDLATSLRARLEATNLALAPLSHEVAAVPSLGARVDELATQAAELRGSVAGGTPLRTLLDALSTAGSTPLGAAIRLEQIAARTVAEGRQALSAAQTDLSLAEERVLHDADQLHLAAQRVRQFADSSKVAIDQLILKLQFQDRTDQILSHLKADFDSLGRTLAAMGESTFDFEAWRRERQQRFTTIEERNAGQVAASTESGEIELF